MAIINDTIKFYFGVVTGVSGERTAASLSYSYVADNINDHNNRIIATQPAKPRRPFDGEIEIEEPLAIGAAIMVFERNRDRTLILIDQEKYAVTECGEPGPGGRPLGLARNMMRGATSR